MRRRSPVNSGRSATPWSTAYQLHRSQSGPISGAGAITPRSRSQVACVLCNSNEHLLLSDKCAASLKQPNTDVSAFKGPSCVFSNFYACRLFVFDKWFTSSEHAYQYIKCVRCGRADVAAQIADARDALDAKRLAKQVRTDATWDAERVEVMYDIIKAKARHVSEYRQALETSKAVIAEAVPFDKFWSAGLAADDLIWARKDKWPGQNQMGRLHMRLRMELFNR